MITISKLNPNRQIELMNSHRYTHLRVSRTINRRAELNDFAKIMRLALFKSKSKTRLIKNTALDLGVMFDDYAEKSSGSERDLYQSQREAFFELSSFTNSQISMVRRKAIAITLVFFFLFLINTQRGGN